jgi:hypothetical protein
MNPPLRSTLPFVLAAAAVLPGVQAAPLSHALIRPYPEASKRPMEKGAALFVDPVKGDDANPGTEAKPFRTAAFAVSRLTPGATLYLHGGTYYENVNVCVQGTEQAPITIRSYPGELAVINGGLRQFQESPATSWTKSPDGPADEYESTVALPNIRDVVASFGDSMIGLQTYAELTDLRSANELWDEAKGQDVKPVYVGPGVRYDKLSGKIRIRLAPTRVPGIPTNYDGPSDPRQIPIVISPFRSVPLHLDGAKYINLEDLFIRGGGYDTVSLDLCEDVSFDNVVIRSGTYGMRLANVVGFKFTHSAIYGNNPPWGFRNENSLRHRKGDGFRDITRLTCHALLVPDTGREFSVYAFPPNDDWEISYSEFTDSHDGIYLGGIGCKFHNNLVENCHDDGIYVSPVYPQRDANELDIYQNVFKRILTPLAFGAEFTTNTDKVFVYRNVFDLRGPVLYGRPSPALPNGTYDSNGAAGDHGSPPWPEMAVYQNTFIMNKARLPMMGVSNPAPNLTSRWIYNNLFLSGDMPTYAGPDPAKKVFEDGNIFFGKLNRATPETYFEKYRTSAQYAASKVDYPEGSSTHSRFADPKLTADYTLGDGSAAIDAGVAVPAAWPDPLRDKDKGTPDVGALPQGMPGMIVGRNEAVVGATSMAPQ